MKLTELEEKEKIITEAFRLRDRIEKDARRLSEIDEMIWGLDASKVDLWAEKREIDKRIGKAISDLNGTIMHLNNRGIFDDGQKTLSVCVGVLKGVIADILRRFGI